MTTEFQINASGFSPFEREAIKRSIIDRGREYRMSVHMLTDDGYFRITLKGDRETVITYEAAVKCWFNNQAQATEYLL